MCHGTYLANRVAVKEIMLPAGRSVAKREDVRALFVKEVTIMSKLSHPNVLPYVAPCYVSCLCAARATQRGAECTFELAFSPRFVGTLCIALPWTH